MIKRLSLFLLIFILNAAVVLADDPITNPGCDGGGDPDDTTPCNLPLDTWVYVLVVAAIVFGAYKLYQRNKAVTAL